MRERRTICLMCEGLTICLSRLRGNLKVGVQFREAVMITLLLTLDISGLLLIKIATVCKILAQQS